MSSGAEVNEAERRRWNDDRWTSAWPQRERLTVTAVPHLLEAAALRAGERVVDIGCGAGPSSLAAANAVTPGGTVVGVDVSEALTALARRRAEEAGLTNATFAVADVQVANLPRAPFDVAISQFGVMFFDDPPAAFGNIRRSLRPGGRLVFVCWQEVERNPWHTGVVLRPFVNAPAGGPGPFSLGDAAATTAMLSAAGFVGVESSDRDVTVEAPPTSVFDETQLDFFGVPADSRDAAMTAIGAHLAQFRVDGDRYAFPLRFRIFSATCRS